MVSKAVDNSLISDRDECQNLVNILARYCSASGQNINFTKSFALFSPDSPEDLQQQLCNLLNVQRMDPKARYLGFPSVIGRNKNELFSFILDKVLHKMQGWKQKLLSQVDREILIISVIQAIPSYVMQCYLLPKGFLDKLLTYICRFFGMEMRMQHLFPMEIDFVSQIPISNTGAQDKLVWHYDDKGNYSVCSGYRQALLLKQKDLNHASSSSTPT
nr:ribonuclease H [Tanacetum cinerariifolium]